MSCFVWILQQRKCKYYYKFVCTSFCFFFHLLLFFRRQGKMHTIIYTWNFELCGILCVPLYSRARRLVLFYIEDNKAFVWKSLLFIFSSCTVNKYKAFENEKWLLFFEICVICMHTREIQNKDIIRYCWWQNTKRNVYSIQNMHRVWLYCNVAHVHLNVLYTTH